MTNKTTIIASTLLTMCLVTTSTANLAADIFIGNNFVQMENTYQGTQYNYGIGKYELSQSQWNAFAAEAASNGQTLYDQTIFSGYDGPYDWSVETGSTEVPATIMNWYQAAQFCNYMTSGNINDGAYVFNQNGIFVSTDRTAALGMHQTVFVLPTVNEWMNAAYYNENNPTTYNLYATKDNDQPSGWANQTYDNDPTNPLSLDSNIDAPEYPDSIFTPWIVGSGTEELNGTYDMMGNVWEWIEDGGDWYVNEDGDVFVYEDGVLVDENGNVYTDEDGDLELKERPLIGGSAHGANHIASTNPQIPAGIWTEFQAGPWSGLRIAAVGDLSAIPEPASIAMIALVSGVALFVRRWFLI